MMGGNDNSMEGVDWNEMWMSSMNKSSWRKKNGDIDNFWDCKRAERYNQSTNENHSKKLISTMDIDPDCTVIDIGSGPGTLTIPMARKAKHVTAVEPSFWMLHHLKENVEKAGLFNVSWIKKRWENVVLFEDLKPHDIVVASYSLSMLNMKDALSKMNCLANRTVYLFTGTGCRINKQNDLWNQLYGEDYNLGPDYIYIYNILYDMGIYANVEIQNGCHAPQRFSSLGEATNQWMENLEVHSPEGEAIIRKYLSTYLVKEDGAWWSKSDMKDVIIWWDKV